MPGAARIVHRVRAASPAAKDALIAAGVELLAIAELSTQLHSHYFKAGSVIALALPPTLAWRRRAPYRAMLAALVAFSALEATAGVVNWTTVPVTLGALSFAIGAAAVDGRRVLLAGAFGLWAATLVAIDPSTSSASGTAVGVCIFFVAPLLAGRMLTMRAESHAVAAADAARMEREQAEHAREAAAQERVRVARELHDVLAHSVSVMVIQTEAARAVAATQPGVAVQALASVESAGRDALIEMRRTVGVLRNDGAGGAVGPTPGLADLPRLAERARDAGLPVEVAVRGDVRPLPPGLDLVGYRVVQEAITNAIKHAGPARARVEVEYAPRELRIEVADTGRGLVATTANEGGHGLVGMRERVSLYGGTVRTGRAGAHGFLVRARIPFEQALA